MNEIREKIEGTVERIPYADLPPTSVMEQILSHHLHHPIIFKKTPPSWIQLPKSPQDLVDAYGDVKLDFRIVKRNSNKIAWEGESDNIIQATISEFIRWQRDDHDESSDRNPFAGVSKKDHWAYASYNYLEQILPSQKTKNAIDWSQLGFPFEKYQYDDSAVWLGSADSYTPCHYDSYGINLVAQLIGRKKWILFPRTDLDCMYPTRIPYEESSVFSSVDILNPDLAAHKKFQKCRPHVVVLEPGDVLFVPSQWWHFVSSLDDICLSVNSWIKQKEDSRRRLDEAITQALLADLIVRYEPANGTWLNPNQMLSDEPLEYVKLALKAMGEESAEDAKTKTRKRARDADVHYELEVDSLLKCPGVTKVPSVSFEELYPNCETNTEEDSKLKDVSDKDIVNCFVHSSVISVISKLLKEVAL